jgi:hypothetical protein
MSTYSSFGSETMVNLRRYERVTFYCRLQLTVLPNGPVVPCNSIDISIGGVGLSTALWLNRGQQVRIRFFLHNGTTKEVYEDVLGQVAYSRSDEDGNRVGIEFRAPLDEATQPALVRKIYSL